MPESMREYLARCHCGALTGRFRTAVPTPKWAVRACPCHFCRAHGALTVSDPAGILIFAAEPLGALHRYQFETSSADFLLCRECGVYLGARIQTENGRFGMLNTRTLRPVPGNLPPPNTMDYSAETAEARQARREARWTPLGL